jgi:hypothetical protein
MNKTVISLIAIGGAYMLLPVLLMFAVLWFFDTLRTHAEMRDAAQTATIADWRPEIPQCDQPLWERIKDRCAQEDSHVGP